MSTRNRLLQLLLAALLVTAQLWAPAAVAQAKKPNILVIMGDDVGWFNIGAYHQGIMSGKTPNLDKLAVAGHAVHRLLRRSKLHGGPRELHHRRDADPHRPDDRRPGRRRRRHAGAGRTLATALKAQGYATGQFGKNHLGDLNKFLPTLHGFDEFFGYLYHLDAMSDPYWYLVPDRRGLLQQVRPAQPGPLLCDRHATIRPRCRAGARSASRGSSMKVRCRRSRTCRTCRTCTTCRS